MAFKSSTLAELARMRSLGQRPEDPVVLADDAHGAAWARRNRYYLVDARDLTEDFSAFAGLLVWVRTCKQFGELIELVGELVGVAQFVVLIDSRARRDCEFFSGAAA